MTDRLTDADGTPLRRTLDGDLVVDREAADAPPTVPPIPEGTECADHVGQQARTCCSCWADVRAGERPRWAVGRTY